MYQLCKGHYDSDNYLRSHHTQAKAQGQKLRTHPVGDKLKVPLTSRMVRNEEVDTLMLTKYHPIPCRMVNRKVLDDTIKRLAFFTNSLISDTSNTSLHTPDALTTKKQAIVED